MQDFVLQTQGLCKSYKKHNVLNNVCMNIKRGEIYGFVGENGSGKTTIIRIITGLIKAEQGSYTLFGTPNNSSKIYNCRKKLGAIVETPSIYLNVSALDNLKMQASILGVKDASRCESVLKEVGLGGLLENKKKAGDFSLGMRQRLGIAMALLGEPEFIILDEPMNGLDPAGIIEIRELILKLNKEKNITFLISSHILTELELVATCYGLISKGKLIKEISAEDLKNECRHSVIVDCDDKEKLLLVASKFAKQEDIKQQQNGVRIFGEIDLNGFIGALLEQNIIIKSINTTASSIEEYYMKVVGGRVDD
ncbi:MAG: ATP-binding cassette domain-containing protein [Clostridia bacterium]|nr:ATP-binding cassette domain-containing protein [Clostridia bacterium]